MFGDMGKLLSLVGRIKTELPRIKEELASTEYSAETGGGSVRAVVNGKMQLAKLKISPELLADGDAEMLEDLVKAAVAAAQKQAADAAARAMRKLTGGVDLPGLEGLIP